MMQVKFEEVHIGEKFFDPTCEEEFKKVSDTQAKSLRWDDGGGTDYFGQQEIVEVERP